MQLHLQNKSSSRNILNFKYTKQKCKRGKEKDEVWEVLVRQHSNDADTVSLLMQMAAATCKSLKEKVKDHLPEGLWKSMQEIEVKVQQKSKKQKRKMLTIQIRFRQLVMEQSDDKKTFEISRFEGKPVTINMLISNLEVSIRLEHVTEVEVEETTATEE
ncbi:unnamed protein product [Mytilus coruscus]|uniref:Uncharacterized protein n=1 Tax=Mytilus coruscus TaxID=42192 RepID=A0A6J8AMN5_MYTCO|nr:unnamed protein product [Mytilus coruscus]